MIQPPAEAFLDVCGTRAPLRLEIEHRERREIARPTLALPFALIGRDERADIHLDDPEVSHRHAYLQRVAGRLWCVDLGSRTGTHWDNGDAFAGLLLGRQGIRIGPYTIRQGDEGSLGNDHALAPVNPLSNESDDPALLPRLALEFRGGAAGFRTWMVDRALTLVGRASFCKVRLHSSTISRAHCALLNTPEGLWLIDLLGRDGTYVNDTAVRWARLEHEDELHIEPFRIRVRYLTPLRSTSAENHGPRVTEEHGLIQKKGDNAASEELSLSVHSSLSVANPSPQTFVPSAPVSLMNGNESLLVPLLSQFSLMQQQMFDQFQQTLLLIAQMFGNLHREQMAVVRQELAQIQRLTQELQTLQVEWSQQTPSPPPASSEAAGETPAIRVPTPEREHPARRESAGETPPRPTRPASPDVHTWLSQRLAALQQERQTRWQRIVSLLTGK